MATPLPSWTFQEYLSDPLRPILSHIRVCHANKTQTIQPDTWSHVWQMKGFGAEAPAISIATLLFPLTVEVESQYKQKDSQKPREGKIL